MGVFFRTYISRSWQRVYRTVDWFELPHLRDDVIWYAVRWRKGFSFYNNNLFHWTNLSLQLLYVQFVHLHSKFSNSKTILQNIKSLALPGVIFGWLRVVACIYFGFTVVHDAPNGSALQFYLCVFFCTAFSEYITKRQSILNYQIRPRERPKYLYTTFFAKSLFIILFFFIASLLILASYLHIAYVVMNTVDENFEFKLHMN